MLFSRFFASLIICNLITALSLHMEAYAQTHDPHAGHAHAKTDHEQSSANSEAPPIPQIDHVFTESPDDYTLGDAAAPISIIAYASVTCPHCSQWFIHEWPKVKSALIDSGQIRFTFREFPTAPEQIAMIGFLIANCAAQNGSPNPDATFFSAIEHQMQKQDETFEKLKAGQGEQTFIDIATAAGLDGKAGMETCFQSDPAHKHIYDSRLRAFHGKIPSVPSFVINGSPHTGPNSADDLIAYVTETAQK